MSTFLRAFPVEDISIRAGGDGRTVEAYATVFMREAEIHDFDGHYNEQISPTAFNRTLAQNGTRFGVFYNHGATIFGTPSDRGSMPLGTPLELVADGKGLKTVTRYNKTPLADEVLESIRNGDIRGQSFSGRFVASDKERPRFGFKPDKAGALTTVTRTEIALREYGPTPFPAYVDADIVGVRSLSEQLAGLDEAGRADLLRHLQDGTPLEGSSSESATSSDGEPGSEASLSDEHAARHQFTRLRSKARGEGGPLS